MTGGNDGTCVLRRARNCLLLTVNPKLLLAGHDMSQRATKCMPCKLLDIIHCMTNQGGNWCCKPQAWLVVEAWQLKLTMVCNSRTDTNRNTPSLREQTAHQQIRSQAECESCNLMASKQQVDPAKSSKGQHHAVHVHQTLHHQTTIGFIMSCWSSEAVHKGCTVIR